MSRTIPWTLRLYILINGVVGLACIASCGAAILIMAMLLPEAEPRSGPHYDAHADGVVEGLERTNTEIMNKPVIAVDATFLDDAGERHHVRSYERTVSPPRIGTPVRVSYQREHTERAVIDGMHTHVLPWWLWPLMYVITVGAGVVVAAIGFPARRRALALLRDGQHAVGNVVELKQLPKAWVATIEIRNPQGEPERFESRTDKRGIFTTGANLGVVYEPGALARATVLRSLPGKPVVDENTVRFG